MTKEDLRTTCASVCIAALACVAFAAVTHGFAGVTSDALRRAGLAANPRVLPAIELVDSAGQRLSLRDYGRDPTRVTFVALAYVRCTSVCLTSSSGQSWLQAEIRARGLADRVQLLTLSFDPFGDTPQVLEQHAKQLGADRELWRFATVADTRELPRLLDFFGTVVIPDDLGGYSHNAGLFFIGEDGRLSRAYDTARPDIALAGYLQNHANR